MALYFSRIEIVLSFEVWVNGEKEFTVGSEQAEEFGVYLTTSSVQDEYFSSLVASGFLQSSREFSSEAKWGNRSLRDGDEVIVKVSSSKEADIPVVTEAGVGLVEEAKHAMLCSGCGSSQFEVSEMLSMSRINICRDCVAAFKTIMDDDRGI